MNDGIKIGVSIAILGAAGLLWYRLSGPEDIPDDPQSVTYWKCADCDHVMELTDRGYHQRRALTHQAMSQQSDKGTVQVVGRARALQKVLICENCEHISAHNSNKCPDCATVFRDRNKDGSYNLCPECGWARLGERAYRQKKPRNDDEDF